MAVKPNFARLHAILSQTKLQQTNNAAYQVINQLIDSVELLADQLEQKINEVASQAPPPSTGGGGGTGPDPSNSVNNLDGTNNPGLSSLYSRGDHKHADANRPTDNEKAALVGTNGTPGPTNKFVTASDPAHIGSPGPTGPQGPKGDTGNTGPAGPGVAPGGTTGQILVKTGTPDYQTGWTTPGAPGPHHTTHEFGGSDAVQLAESQVTNLVTDLAGKVSTTDPRLSDTRVPKAHATTHQPGGSDAMAVDASPSTGSLRTLGTGANQAVAGNDSRLSDSRLPIAHALTHGAGGTDQMVSLASFIEVNGIHQALTFRDPGGLVNQRRWRILDYQGDIQVRFEMMDDAGNVVQTPIQFRWDGSVFFTPNKVFEAGRAAAMGIWIDAAFNAGWFTADSSSWSLDGTFLSHAYMLIGQTLHYIMCVGTNHSTLNAPSQILRIVLPNAWTVQRQAVGTAVATGPDYGWQNCMAWAPPGGNQVLVARTLYREGGAGALNTFSTGLLGLFLQIAIPVNV